jgi:hypothetical protein
MGLFNWLFPRPKEEKPKEEKREKKLPITYFGKAVCERCGKETTWKMEEKKAEDDPYFLASPYCIEMHLYPSKPEGWDVQRCESNNATALLLCGVCIESLDSAISNTRKTFFQSAEECNESGSNSVEETGVK